MSASPHLEITSTKPAIIAGAGPVGLSIALALHREGLPVVVLEQRGSTFDLRRASVLQPQALAFFDSLGILEALLERGRIVRRQSWHGLPGPSLAEQRALLDPDSSYPYRLHIPQHELVETLLDSLPFGLVHWNQRLVHAEPSAESVAIRLHDGTRMHGCMLIGADGYGSVVRYLRPVIQDVGATNSFGSCLADDRLAHHLPEDAADRAYFRDENGWLIVMRMREGYRLLYRQPPAVANQQLTEERLPEAFQRFFSQVPQDLFHDWRSFLVEQRLARSFGGERIYLAGDAAHIAFPADGRSLDIGLMDAAELSTAIHRKDPSLLEDYANERPRRLRDGVLYQRGPASLQ